MHNEQVVASLSTDDGYAVNIKTSSHQFISDEPVEVGGQGKGASPYELLLSALGSCTAMTLHMYAKHKQWPLEDVEVELSHAKVHKDDCNRCTEDELENTKGSKIDLITRHIRLTGDLDDEQRQRLIEIANKCPVHRTLHGDIKVETKELRRA